MNKTDENYAEERRIVEEGKSKKNWKALRKVMASLLLMLLSLITLFGFVNWVAFGIVAMLILWFGGWLE